jgi:hypothetical protein
VAGRLAEDGPEWLRELPMSRRPEWVAYQTDGNLVIYNSTSAAV